ncbi:MAG: hypothetical protein KAS86_01260 [Candidatus Omnitrophica bacterium]|nr:hypothetical protein [Candidatus Omnitrophota bacterium]
MKYIVFRSFIRKFDSYQRKEQELVLAALEKIKEYMETSRAPYGLRIKKLSRKIYEGRINIHLRIAYFRERDMVKFFCLGGHDDIKHCLKILRLK